MPVTKAVTKKTAKKAAAVKKVTYDDLMATLDRLSKEQAEERVKARVETERAMREVDERTKKAMQDTHDKTERAIQETIDKAVKAMQEVHEKTEKAIAETQKIVGKLGSRLGDVAEHLLTPNLTEEFKKFGFNFGRMGPNVSMKDKINNIYAETDAMLENGTQAMAVEVKVNLKTTDVDDHIRRMEKIRRYADLHGDTRRYYGAVAAAVVAEEVELYAIRRGFYVIKPSGENVTIVPPVSREVFW